MITSISLNFPNHSRTFYLFDNPLGHHVAREVLSGMSYPILPLTLEVRTILDVGANIGAASVFFALNYPRARIFSFEPSPNSFKLLLDNIQGLNVLPFPFGLSNHEESTTLFLGAEDEVTNSIGKSVFNSQSGISVSLQETAAVLREQDIQTIDILKLDTEGYELPILQSLAPWLEQTGLIYLEYHSAADRREIDSLLKGHLLCRGTISSPHRGELCYILPNCIPPGWNQEMIPPVRS